MIEAKDSDPLQEDPYAGLYYGEPVRTRLARGEGWELIHWASEEARWYEIQLAYGSPATSLAEAIACIPEKVTGLENPDESNGVLSLFYGAPVNLRV